MLQSAKWIAASENTGHCVPAFRCCFTAKKEVVRGEMLITALGFYEARLNGRRVGDFILAPGWTVFEKRLQFQQYDVTPLLQRENELHVFVGRGWYTGPDLWAEKNGWTGRQNALLCALKLVYADGSEECLLSDEGWEWGYTGWVENDIYNGECCDSRARSERFRPVKICDLSKDMLIPQEGENVREIMQLSPCSIFTTPKGETVIDFGQNLTGYVRFRVCGNAGDRVELSHGEVLDADGNFYTANLRSAKAQVTFICDGTDQMYSPHFSFQGFRYVRVDAYPGEVKAENFAAVVLCSDLKRTGYFECSHPKLNQLFSNIVWGQMGNYLDVPTDCPQRDERLGWTGDAQAFVRTGSYNFDVRRFFHKWLHDLAADQRPDGAVAYVVPHVLGDGDFASAAWGDAAVICPWQIYLTYGDKSILEEQFDSAKGWVDHIRSCETEGHLWLGGTHFGDWLGLDAEDGAYTGATDKDYIASAFYAYSTGLLIKMGEVIGKDMAEYKMLYAGILADFRKRFIRDGKPASDTQTAHVLALYFDLTPDKAVTLAGLVRLLEASRYHLTTGFVGTPYLLHVLSDNGRADLAYTLLLQEDYPSWLFSVNMGATTMWEHWDGLKPDGTMWSTDMNSFNHYAYGAVGDWMYGVMCGIRTDEQAPGFRHSVLAPVPDGRLAYAKASVETAFGCLSSGWEKEENGYVYTFRVPRGTTATLLADGGSFEVEAGEYRLQNGDLTVLAQ